MPTVFRYLGVPAFSLPKEAIPAISLPSIQREVEVRELAVRVQGLTVSSNDTFDLGRLKENRVQFIGIDLVNREDGPVDIRETIVTDQIILTGNQSPTGRTIAANSEYNFVIGKRSTDLEDFEETLQITYRYQNQNFDQEILIRFTSIPVDVVDRTPPEDANYPTKLTPDSYGDSYEGGKRITGDPRTPRKPL